MSNVRQSNNDKGPGFGRSGREGQLANYSLLQCLVFCRDAEAMRLKQQKAADKKGAAEAGAEGGAGTSK